MSNDNGLPPSVVETIAGLAAGVVTTLAVHPLDIIKTRLQVDRQSSSRLGSSVRIARDIARNEGSSLQAFYRGLTPNLVGNSASWGLYFLWYGKIKEALREYYGPLRPFSSLDYLLASGTSGTLTALFTNPIWVVKTRMLSSGRAAPGAYQGLGDGFRQIIATEGIRGLYRGLVPSLFGVSHGAFQFMFYEQLKNRRAGLLLAEREGLPQGSPGDSPVHLSNMDYLYLSGLSKVYAGVLTYPYQVLRARLQTYDAEGTYTSARDAVMQIWRREGILGFYKGLGPNLVRVVPSTCITFLVYENTRYYLPRLHL